MTIAYLLVYQISVDEVAVLQVRHPLTDIHAHTQHGVLRKVPLPGSQVVRQTAVVHELKHQTHGGALGVHGVELDQLTMRQPPVKMHADPLVSRRVRHDRPEATP